MKKVLIGIAALGIVIIGAFAFIWSNLDSIVKTVIETKGSEATQTTVSVDAVHLDLKNGKAEVTGLSIGNPDGFTDPNIFHLGDIKTKIDLATLQQNPLVIDEIHVSAPDVVYEINKTGLANADKLKQNLGVGSGGDASSSGGEETKMIIRKLVIEGGKAKVRIAALGREQSITLPRIVMTDIGKKSGGATAAEVAQQVTGKLLGNLKGGVAGLGVNRYIGKSADQLKQQVGGAGGGAADKATGALKGLLGK